MQMSKTLPNKNLKQNQKKRKYYGCYRKKGKIPSLLKHRTLTKMLQNEIYDPLEFVLSCLLLGKTIYCNLCDLKVYGIKKPL